MNAKDLLDSIVTDVSEEIMADAIQQRADEASEERDSAVELEMELRHQLDEALAREKRYRDALEALIVKLDACEPQLNGCIQISTVHGFPYTGPNYGNELEAARELMSGAPTSGTSDRERLNYLLDQMSPSMFPDHGLYAIQQIAKAMRKDGAHNQAVNGIAAIDAALAKRPLPTPPVGTQEQG